MQENLGPLIVDLQGTEIDAEEAEILQHPLVGGVILFARNFINAQQLESLCAAIHQKKKNLFIMVDQEGGRVQRFKQDFTRLPSLYTLGLLYLKDKKLAGHAAKECGWLMAHELLTVGITNSLAPVLDLYHEKSHVIGDRAFSDDIEALVSLSEFYRQGMHEAGMMSIGKHFPGHGNVIIDSHFAIPHDSKSLSELESTDLKPFVISIKNGLKAIMVAHIIFEKIDSVPITYSSIWLNELLRKKYNFQGVIISDDLHMEGANIDASYEQRFLMARRAGCDFAILCNYRPGVVEILNNSHRISEAVPKEKWQYLQPTLGKVSSNNYDRLLSAQSLVYSLTTTQ